MTDADNRVEWDFPLLYINAFLMILSRIFMVNIFIQMDDFAKQKQAHKIW